VVIGNGTSGVTVILGAAGTIFTGQGASADPSFTATPTLGVAGTTLGSLAFAGNTSGTITISPQAAAGTYNFNLPTTAGTSGQVLTSAGGGGSPMTWAANGGGTVPSQTTYVSNTATLTLASTNLLTEVISQATPAALTVNLPTGQANGFRQCVKDGTNNFSTNTATVKTTDGSTVDGVAGTTGDAMSGPAHQEHCYQFDGTSKWAIE
jgi:hypothetical protein